MNYGDRIRMVRERVKLTQQSFGLFAGVNKQVMYNIEKGRSEPSSVFLTILSEHFNVNVNWILTGQGEMFLAKENSKAISSLGAVSLREIQDTDTSDIIRVPLLDVSASAGKGLINYDDSVTRWVGLPDIFIFPHNPKHVALLEAKGFSMMPTIDNKDMLLVAENETELISEKVYIIRIAEELRVKRLVKLSNSNIVIWSENESYGREELTPQQWDERGIQIMAKVIKVIKDV